MGKAFTTTNESGIQIHQRRLSTKCYKVVEDIAAAVNKAMTNPEFYSPDKYKINNDDSYRAFEKHRYRIVYRFTKNIIRVLRVRHTTMEPKPF